MQLHDPLELQPEPANPYDRHAVRIHWKTHHIGYLPRESNHIVSRLLRQNCPLTAHIAWLAKEPHPTIPLTLEVLLEESGSNSPTERKPDTTN